MKRAKFSTLNATLWPLPTSPSTFSAGTRTSWKISGQVDEPCRPILCSSLPLFTPQARSTRNAVNCSPSTFAKTTKRSAKPPFVIHIFSPFSRKLPSGCRVAFVRAPIASDPDPDSLRPYAPRISPLSSFGRYFCFCASLPKSISGTIVRLAWAPNVAPKDADRASFSLTTSEVTLSRPRPP